MKNLSLQTDICWYWDISGYWNCPICGYSHDFLPGEFRCYHCNQISNRPSEFDISKAEEYQKEMML